MKYIRNVGRFATVDAQNLPFSSFTLIHAENGRGKTTFSDILRSLSTGEPKYIEGRTRLGENDPAKVVIELDGTQSQTAVFDKKQWNVGPQNIEIFDDLFVASNISFGLKVANEHRVNLYDLVFGDAAVSFTEDIENLNAIVAKHNRSTSELREDVIGKGTFGLSFNEFRGLVQRPDIEDVLERAEKSLLAAKKHDEVDKTECLKELELPSFEIRAAEELLARSLEELDSEAVQHVLAHAGKLGTDGESWLSDGVTMMRESKDADMCPFCGQKIEGLKLVDYYRAYFGLAYRDLKKQVGLELISMDDVHGSEAQTKLIRTMLENSKLLAFWAVLCDVEEVREDSETFVEVWARAAKAMKAQLNSKAASPLERMQLSDETRRIFSEYSGAMATIAEVNQCVAITNDTIGKVKQSTATADVTSLENECARLRAVRARYEASYLELFTQYEDIQSSKDEVVRRLEDAKEELERERKAQFEQYQKGVNVYLEKFGAGYRLQNFMFQDRGSRPTSRYDIDILGKRVAVRSENVNDAAPSFQNTLSAGDRTTLGLAFFLEHLRQKTDLGKTVVIVDDPASSLDEHRSRATMEELLWLGDTAEQVIVLSHSRSFLAQTYELVGKAVVTGLHLVRDGESSKFETWDVVKEAATRHDDRYALFQQYLASESVEKRAVAQALRPHLERFLRVAYPGEFPAGCPLPVFEGQCDKVLNPADAREIRALIKYGNRYQHDTNRAYDTETILDTELVTYVGRVLKFTKR